MLKKSILIIILVITGGGYIFADPDSDIPKRDKYGAYFNYNLNNHISSFSKLPDIPNCCPSFTQGSGSGFSAGLLYEIPLWQSSSLQLRTGITTQDATLKSTESEIVNLNNTGVNGEFEHTLKAGLSLFDFEPMISYKITSDLSVNIGIYGGFLLKKIYEQKETITKPTGAVTFLDSLGKDTGKRTRNELSGDIPKSVNFQAGLLAGISYELPLNKNRDLMAVPELIFSYGLTNLVENLNWKRNSLRIGLSIKYIPPLPQIEKITKPDEIKIDTTPKVITYIDSPIVLKPRLETQKLDLVKKNTVLYFNAAGAITNNRTNKPEPDVEIVIRENLKDTQKKPFYKTIVNDSTGKFNLTGVNKKKLYQINSVKSELFWDNFIIIIKNQDTSVVINLNEQNRKKLAKIIKYPSPKYKVNEIIKDREYEITGNTGDLFWDNFKLKIEDQEIEVNFNSNSNVLSKVINDKSGNYEVKEVNFENEYHYTTNSPGLIFSKCKVCENAKDTSIVFRPDSNAKFSFPMEKGREYEVTIQGTNILNNTFILDVPEDDTTSIKNFFIDVSDKLVLRINFPYKEFENPYQNTLDSNGNETKISWERVTQILAENLLLNLDRIEKLILVGHADDVGPDDFNNTLALNRVKFIKAELVKLGVPPEKLEIRSEGKNQLLPIRQGEDPEVWRKRLRRVELFKVLEKNEK